MRVRPPRPVWDAAYERELDAQLLVRVRWGVALCLVALVFSLIDLNVDDALEAHARAAFLYLFATITVTIGLTSLLPAGRRHARSVVLGYALALVVALVWYARTIPNGIAVAAASLTSLSMGCAILFPWGAQFQLLIASVVTLAFTMLGILSPEPPTSALLSVVFSTAIVSTAGAAMLDRYRRTSFARSWLQDRLVALGRDLQQTRPPDEVAATIAHHALEHVPDGLVTVAVRHVDQDVYRVAAVEGTRAADHQDLLGLEVPSDSPILAEICARPHLLMPAGAPASKLGEFFVDRPDVRSLYVALRHGTEIEGIIGWTRRRADFAAAEVDVVQQFVTHAALGLRTARAISELRQMNRLKSEFVSTVSHELRTPLNVILGYAEMARDPGIESDDRQTFLDRIDSAARELLDLIESTLEVGRLEAAQSPVRLETVKLADFWAELGLVCGKTPRAPGVRLLWDEADEITVVTDPHKLSVITRNLIGNACKFTTQGEVRGRLRLERETLVLDVIDTGIGISTADRHVIFDLFRQGDSSDSRRYGGTGLGLYIVQRFCTQLGASIDLKSQLGAGAHFTVRIPVTRSRDVQHAA
jgi:signal transduction histidine kinase